MLLNLNKKLKFAKGYEGRESLADLTIAALEQGNSGRPRKAISLANKLAANGEIEIDEDDLRFLENCIEKSTVLLDIAKNAILEIIDQLRSSQSK